MQLSEVSNQFTSIGVEILTVTYDSNEDAKVFFDQRNLTFPILFDDQSKVIKQLGILNPGPKPGDRFYGIPYPGIFLVDSDGVIRAKFAEESYRDRPALENVLEAAKTL